MRLTTPQQNALFGRPPFTMSGDTEGPEGEQWWIPPNVTGEPYDDEDK